MSILGIVERLPDFASDIKKTVLAILDNHDQTFSLSRKQLCGVALSMAYHLGHEQVLNSIRSEAKLYLEETDADACKIAATMMSMTNTYYKFTDLVEDPEYKLMNSDLSMDSLLNLNVPKHDMDLYCLGVSVLNGCKHCINVHVKRLLNYGDTKKVIHDVVRIAALLKAAVSAFEISRMRSYDFMVRDASID